VTSFEEPSDGFVKNPLYPCVIYSISIVHAPATFNFQP